MFLLLASPLLHAEPEPTKTELAKKAPTILKSAQQFAIGGVGIAGTTSPAESALRALLNRPDAVAECKKLVSDATPAGKLYGLLGLKLKDAKAFEEAFPAFKDSKTAVSTASGCIPYETTIGKIASDIRDGKLK
ncbi:hypothetical protein KBB96_15090 [Luteolibacter ambystomatis]|uniref:Uncharacterized protein n=1 Tax=Luteolibacter ambystomatis TaxID=2824561 RepID=A0A975IYS7_9BACT|nr:hypothetical protein [Luteolibacter ambystomatis]QUE50188.1 hypothetical protein KBB96_15090 [Luteolibacter ambystomatis]